VNHSGILSVSSSISVVVTFPVVIVEVVVVIIVIFEMVVMRSTILSLGKLTIFHFETDVHK